MNKLLGCACTLALASLAVSPARAAVTFESANVISNASAYTNYGAPNQGTGYGTDSEALTSFGSSVMATASAQADSYTGLSLASSGTGLEESSASFASAASGTLDLAGITSATSNMASGLGQAYSEGQSAIYNFGVTSPSTFSLGYSYSESDSDPYFYNSIYFANATTGAVITSLSPSGANTSGLMSFAIASGDYTLSVYTQEGDFTYADSSTPNTAGNHEELYNFAITSAAPEPGIWALMVVGMGGIGLGLRRSKKTSEWQKTAIAC